MKAGRVADLFTSYYRGNSGRDIELTRQSGEECVWSGASLERQSCSFTVESQVLVGVRQFPAESARACFSLHLMRSRARLRVSTVVLLARRSAFFARSWKPWRFRNLHPFLGPSHSRTRGLVLGMEPELSTRNNLRNVHGPLRLYKFQIRNPRVAIRGRSGRATKRCPSRTLDSFAIELSGSHCSSCSPTP